MSMHRASKYYVRPPDGLGGLSRTKLVCSCGTWEGVTGALERDQRAAHRQHRVDMGETVKDVKDSNRCFHCGRPTGGTQGGYATIDSHLVCRPSVPDRPNCYELVTEFGEELGSRKVPSPEEITTWVRHAERRLTSDPPSKIYFLVHGGSLNEPWDDAWRVTVTCDHGSFSHRTDDHDGLHQAYAEAGRRFIKWHDDRAEAMKNDEN